MITLTEVAAVQFHNLLNQKEMSDHGLRVFVQGGGCAGLQYGMVFEKESREGDAVFETEGIRLYVDPFIAQ